MKPFGGWQFPDGEEHLIGWMAKRNEMVDGRLSYQWQKLSMALSHVRAWRCAVDVGAHVGLFAHHLASRFERVEAFEPVAAHRECFLVNVTAPNVTLHPVALGSETGPARVKIYPGNSGATHVSRETETGERVQLKTLDSFGLENVDFLKLDAEGYELEVLRGAVETLARCRPTLMVEQKAQNGSRYGYDDRAALPFLHNLGARVIAEKSRDYVLVWR